MKCKKILSILLAGIIIFDPLGNAIVSYAAPTVEESVQSDAIVEEQIGEKAADEITESDEKTQDSVEEKIEGPIENEKPVDIPDEFILENVVNETTASIQAEDFDFSAVLSSLIETDHFYEVYTGLNADIQKEFLSNLSDDEAYLLKTCAKYAFIDTLTAYREKEQLEESDMKILASYADVYASFAEKLLEHSLWNAEEVLKLDQEAFSYLTASLDKEAIEKQGIKDLETYAEYLQSMTSINVLEVLEELSKFDSSSRDTLQKVTKEFRNYLYATYGFDSLIEEIPEDEKKEEEKTEANQSKDETADSEKENSEPENGDVADETPNKSEESDDFANISDAKEESDEDQSHSNEIAENQEKEEDAFEENASGEKEEADFEDTKAIASSANSFTESVTSSEFDFTSAVKALVESRCFYAAFSLVDKDTKNAFYGKLSDSEYQQFLNVLEYEFLNEVAKLGDDVSNEEVDVLVQYFTLFSDALYGTLDKESFFDSFIERKSYSILTSGDGKIFDFFGNLDSYFEDLQSKTSIDLTALKKRIDALNLESEDGFRGGFHEFRSHLYEVFGLEESPYVIKDFVDFDEHGNTPYKEISILNDERSIIDEKLPRTIEVELESGYTDYAYVKWESQDDIEKTEYKSYTYELVLPENYLLSRELQDAFDNFQISLPFIDVNVNVEKESGIEEKATYVAYSWFNNRDNYFTSLEAAFNAIPSGAEIFVLQNCTFSAPLIYKSFTLLPEWDGVTVTNVSIDPSYSAMFRQASDNWSGYTWNFGGHTGNYRLNLNGNGKGGSGVISVNNVTININSGANIYNSKTNGIWNESGTTNVHNNTFIHDNKHAGIASWGTVNIYGGSIYNNSVRGVGSHIINISGGSIYGNPIGAHLVGELGSNSLNMTGGSIFNNTNGMELYSNNGNISVGINGGSIYGNNYGVYIGSNGTLTQNGGEIRNNTYGIVQNSATYNFRGGSIHDNHNNDAGAAVMVNAGVFNASGGNIYNNSARWGGAIIMNNGTLNATGSAIYNNSASDAGGGIFMKNSAVVYISEGSISGNKTSGSGGGLYKENGTLTVNGAIWDGNTAASAGGAMYLSGGGNIPTINYTATRNNSAQSGGGIFTAKSANMTGNTFSNNRATNDAGGAIHIGNGTLTLNSNTITGNSAASRGGGVSTWDNGHVQYISGNLSGNSANYGGGFSIASSNHSASLTIAGGYINSNTANGNGGAIASSNGTVYANGGEINYNAAANAGGGIMNDGNSALSLNGTTIASNTAANYGGGVHNDGSCTLSGSAVHNNITTVYHGAGIFNNGSFTMTFGSISGNVAQEYGGGLFTNNSVTLSGGTISNNTAKTQSGGGVYLNYKAITLNGTNITGNTAGNVGGGIATYAQTGAAAATINFSKGQVSNNKAKYGGGIYVGNNTVLNMSGGTVSNNSATANGAGIYITDYSTANLTNAKILSNTASGGGGGIYNHSSLTINASNIDQNTANASGGGVHNGGTVTMNSGSISGNISKSYAGGIDNGGTFNFKGGSISNNTAATYGAGFRMWGGTLNMSGGSINGNKAQNGVGGGICINLATGYTGSASITGGIVSGNTANGYGGGIYTGIGLNISNTEISSNTGTYGGGLATVDNGTLQLKIENCNIKNNVAKNYGGGIYANMITTLNNNAISGNKAESGGGGGVYLNYYTLNLNGNTFTGNSAPGYRGGAVGSFQGIVNHNSGTMSGNTSPNGGAISVDGGAASGGSNKIANLNFNNGTISGNTATTFGGAIEGNELSAINLAGGTIIGNKVGSGKGNGVYAGNNIIMSGSAKVDTNNDIYLPTGIFISVPAALTQNGVVAKVTPEDYSNGRKVVEVRYGNKLGSMVHEKFSITPKDVFVLRPSDYLDNGTYAVKSDVIVSSGYSITYDENINRAVENMPAAQTKYWNEKIKLSAQIPACDIAKHIGWNTDSKASIGQAEYAPGNTVTENRNISLYGIWNYNDLITTFHRNTSDADTVTEKQTFKYGVAGQKFTDKGWSKTGYTLLGWADSKTATKEQYAILSGVSDNWIVNHLPKNDVYAVWKANQYTVVFDGNGATGGTTPSVNATYDQNFKIPENGFQKGPFKFIEWNTKADGSGTSYLPGNNAKNLTSAADGKVTLYAIWEEEVKVVYEGNGATSGTQKTEYVNRDDLDEKYQYSVQKNEAYTDYEREDHQFDGWWWIEQSNYLQDHSKYYQDENTNKVPWDLLIGNAEASVRMPFRAVGFAALANVKAANETKTVPLYAQWDEEPKLHITDGEEGKNLRTFYEGQTIKASDLLNGISATDTEDDQTKTPMDIKIVKIEYAAGKLVDGEEQPAYTKTYTNGMTDKDNLDTWFLQMNKDATVTHKVTYEVTDSAGNTVQAVGNVYVKYNSFPAITAEDRYFTLGEAQAGKITKEELLDNQLTSDNIKVFDKEEGTFTEVGDGAGKVNLVDFDADEFQNFTESGYRKVTIHTQDSYGPDGKGKESVKQITVYVVKDGELPDVNKAKEVRFIDKENYDKNKGVDPSVMTDAEKAERNSNGGLNVDSKWYQNEEYKNLIEDTFGKTSGESYRFTEEEINQIKEYVAVHGLGNMKEEDALSNFADEFLN